VAAFQTEYEDEILFDFVANQSQNVTKAQVNGVETSYSGRFAGTDLTAALTVQDVVEQQADGTERAGLRRAKIFGSITAFRSFSRWRVGGELLTSGSRPDVVVTSFAGERTQLPGYAVLNLLARFNYTKNLFFAARLENALDEDYQLAHGFNTAPRGLFITVGWQP
jgi:vitamin B12 transporter